jgi:hypothetical protein
VPRNKYGKVVCPECHAEITLRKPLHQRSRCTRCYYFYFADLQPKEKVEIKTSQEVEKSYFRAEFAEIVSKMIENLGKLEAMVERV